MHNPPGDWKMPMLATLSQSVPETDNWIFESKLDGLRCIAMKRGQEVNLWSRNKLSYNARFPDVVAALQRLAVDDFVLDGEIVSYEGDKTSFSALQRTDVAVLCLFDVSSLLGRDVTGLPIEQRKALLKRAITQDEKLRLVEPLEGNGEALLAHAYAHGWEGIVAKRHGSLYVHGRSRDWLKLKCLASQELVIGGWTEPNGMRRGLGALLVGYYDDGRLRYAGKVGTGFSHAVLESLFAELVLGEVPVSPFADEIRERSAHWTEPKLVAQIAFSEWTPDGKLRHPRYEGLRTDKPPDQITREHP